MTSAIGPSTITVKSRGCNEAWFSPLANFWLISLLRSRKISQIQCKNHPHLQRSDNTSRCGFTALTGSGPRRFLWMFKIIALMDVKGDSIAHPKRCWRLHGAHIGVLLFWTPWKRPFRCYLGLTSHYLYIRRTWLKKQIVSVISIWTKWIHF